MENNKEAQRGEAEKAIIKKKKRSPVFFIIFGILLITGSILGVTWYKHAQVHEETDDAQVQANVAPVISKISGYIAEVKVKDNQYVHKGDVLLVLDDKDLKMNLNQAIAALQTAKSNLVATKAGSAAAAKAIGTSNAAVSTANAQIEAAKVSVWRTTQDLQRYDNLIKDHSITQQQYEQALAAKQTAEKQLQILMEQRNQAQAQTGVVRSQSGASDAQIGIATSNIGQREVEVENARQNLSYTIIVAPEDGSVSKIPVLPGQFIQAGAQLFSIVKSGHPWIVANFKETQLSKITEGQKVSIKADAFPQHEFEGSVTSFSPATGSQFALLPPDNASGNFVKVVQRLPVRIDFTNSKDSLIKKLRAGMNVKVDVSLK